MAQRSAASRLAARAGTGSPAEAGDHANLGARAMAYLLDSLVLFGFTMAFVGVAFLNIYLRSDSGRADPSDMAIWDSVIVLMGTVPAWALFNLFFAARRGQTVGQYVVGLRLAKRDGSSPGLMRLLVYFAALHPLLFHPILAGFWVLLAYVSLSLSDNTAIVVSGAAVAVLSLLAPMAGAAFALGDPQRRGLHDWIAGLHVVRIE